MKKIVLFQILLAGILISLASCSKDDTPGDPEGTATLNMLDERNGRTLLGASDVYINKANNFFTILCYIADEGSAHGIGATGEPMLGNLLREVAVIPGHVYQVFDRETVWVFPSGNKAVEVGYAYYQCYVESPILVDDQSAGAVIRYVSVYPETRGLPVSGHKLGDLSEVEQSVSMKLPKGAECVWDEGRMLNVFDISVAGGKLKMTLIQYPYYEITGDYEVYIRVGSVFTRVVARVE